MEIRNSQAFRALQGSKNGGGLRWLLFILFSTFALIAAGCASPGEPLERRPPVPTAVSDLAAHQSGNNVILTFTLPTETTQHLALAHSPEIEIYRTFAPVSSPTPLATQAGKTAGGTPTLFLTIPSAMVAQYVAQNHVRYEDALKPEDFAQNRELQAVYMVRTRASEKRASADSNLAALSIFPSALPIADARARVTHAAIILDWTPPQKTLAGSAVSLAGYRMYRGEADASVPESAGETPKLKSPLAPIGDAGSSANTFSDYNFEFGNTYVYSVRSLVQYSGETLESADSNWVVVKPRDTFPPSVPQGLIVTMAPEQGQTPAHLELSWAINSETDIAGYNVYRSEQEGTAGTRLNTEVLLTPAFRDMNAVPGRLYFYSVTAVDRTGNESAASAAVSGSVPPQ
ncbi:MAG: fibronectin type III domain-containing protein [Candidatus Acidiferrales bacterium]